MKLVDLSCENFSKHLAAKEPVPGGGSVTAFMGALGIALGSMVSNFSTEKKHLLVYSEQHKDILNKAEELREKLISLVDKDAQNFEPLSKVYGMSSVTEEEKKIKEEKMQNCLKDACEAPIEMLKYIYESILLHEKLVDISSKTIISDIAVGIQCLKGALYSSYINILVNINSITDDEYVELHKNNAQNILKDGSKLADEIYEKVLNKLNK